MSFRHVPSGPDAVVANLRARVTKLETETERLASEMREGVAAIARPGDTVILAFSTTLDEQDIEHLEAVFKPLERNGITVAFTDQVASAVVVSQHGARLTREEEADEARAASDEELYGPEDI